VSVPEYVEALGVLSRAQAAARAREGRIEAELARLERDADEALRSAAERREELERRLRELSERVAVVMAELRVPPDGPVHEVQLPPPLSTPDALATLDAFERQLQEYAGRTTIGPTAVPSRPPPRRRWPVVLAVGVLLVAVLLIVAITV
jgi:hypothetical protein